MSCNSGSGTSTAAATASLHEVSLHRDREKPMGRVDVVRTQSHKSRNLLNSSFPAREGVLPRLTAEAVLSPPPSSAGPTCAEAPGRIRANELSHHRTAAAGALDEFDRRDDGILLDDDSAVGADGRTGWTEGFDVG